MRFLLPILLVAILLPGCSRSPNSTGSGAKKYKLAFVTNNASDFWSIARRGCEAASKELGNVDVQFLIPSDGTAAEQKRIVDDLLARGIDGIAISPVDPANQTEMLNAAVKQTVVITHDSDAPKSDRACYIGTDNRAAGKQAGGLIKEAIPNGGKIMIFVGNLDAQNARERIDGVKEVLAGSNIEVVDVRTDGTDQVRAKSNVIDALVKQPDLACLVGIWAYNGPAILNAVKDANKTGQVKIVCFDEDEATLTGIKDGAIYATVVQQPYEFGNRAIKAMATILGGDKSVIPASKQDLVPTLTIKKDNVEDFSEKIKKLRGH